jgi:hypothetical protein
LNDVYQVILGLRGDDDGVGDYMVVVFFKVILGLPGDDEDTNDLGQMEHVEDELLRVSWVAHDFESDIMQIRLCLGVEGSQCLQDGNAVRVIEAASLQAGATTVLDHSSLQMAVVYQVVLQVINGAGVASAVAVSKPFIIIQGNTAGIVSFQYLYRNKSSIFSMEKAFCLVLEKIFTRECNLFLITAFGFR